MAYDVTKLTNLGQMKSALQRIYTEVTNSKSVRSIATISPSNWDTYDNIFRYSNICAVSNRHYYDVHLSADTSNAISIMCANADIRAKIEGSQINLYCYGTKPTQAFTLEIIVTPTTTNDVGISYDIGDDYLVYPQITDALNARLTSLETSASKLLLTASNITLEASRWTSSGVSAYPYKAVINMADVTADYFPIVQFRDSDSLSYDFSPSATSGTGTITVYCKTAPSTQVVIANIFCQKGTTVTAS